MSAPIIHSLADLTLLRETFEIECKLAQGKDGNGALPEDFWPTYSAFANTSGGMVLLGVGEKKGRFFVAGIKNPSKVKAELFSAANNRTKVSFNLLKNESVSDLEVDGKTIICVEVPRASRKQRPIYLTQNPLSGNTYRRLNESDCALSDEDIKRMLAEQVEDTRDSKLLIGYTIEDLDSETLRAYRQVFSNRQPEHPWNTVDDLEFLRSIGGWRRDRETGDKGITLAGLLMFGRMQAIQEALPYYMVDYQERPEAKAEKRWIDRLTLDGMWSGNLYDFYRRVYLKLTSDLKVPFRLEKGERQDETPVHVALREALANALAHADYSDRASVLIVKRPDMFGFRNPGIMRIPVEVALHGGEPDCRNRTLQRMFRFVGVGEQAGTGIPKIFQGWRSQHWSPPKLYEAVQPYNQTLLELRMIDFFPPEVMDGLRLRFGAAFEVLTEDERLALGLSASEGTVNHARLCTVSTSHPAELSKTLQHLVQLDMLISSGGGRGAVYHLRGSEVATPDDVFGPMLPSSIYRGLHIVGEKQRSSSSGLPSSFSGSLGRSSPSTRFRNDEGYLISEQLQLPMIDNIDDLSSPLRSKLEELARLPRTKAKVGRAELEAVLLAICDGHYLSLQSIARLVNRQPSSLRNEYLSRMVKSRTLSLAFPSTPTHERQAYCSSASLLRIGGPN